MLLRQEEEALEQKQMYKQENWKIVRNRVCIRALLIFLGIILMQVLAYMLCVAGMMLYGLATRQQMTGFLESLMEADTDNGAFMITISSVSAILSGIWCCILYMRSDWREHPFSYRSAFSGKNVLAIVGGGMGGCIILTFILTGLSSAVPEAFSSYNQVMAHLTDKTMLLTGLYVLLIGPVSEELIFRGAILDRLYLAFPFAAANILQAVLFGIYHMNVIQGIYAFLLGVFLGMLRNVTGSILAPVAAHILFNGTSYVLSYLFPEGGKTEWLSAAVLIFAGAVALLTSVCYLFRVGKQSATDEI